jgi:hypothetical protein
MHHIIHQILSNKIILNKNYLVFPSHMVLFNKPPSPFLFQIKEKKINPTKLEVNILKCYLHFSDSLSRDFQT